MKKIEKSTKPVEDFLIGFIGILFMIILLVVGNMAVANAQTIGKASYYADKFHGRKTASGEVFDMNTLTAAHKTLPFGTKLKVTNLKTKKSVIVTINDRGPFIKGRILDLSKAAFKKIANINRGVITIKFIKL